MQTSVFWLSQAVYKISICFWSYFTRGGGNFGSHFVFCDKSLKKNIFISNQLDFESKFITINSWKFEFAKVTGSFPIFEVFRTHFPKSGHFWPILNLNDVIRRFCDVISWLGHWMIQYQKQLLKKIWTACYVITKWRHFRKFSLDITKMTSSFQIFFFNFGEHQPAFRF